MGDLIEKSFKDTFGKSEHESNTYLGTLSSSYTGIANKIASSSDRHQAVVQGQEDLSGVKSLNIKRNIKKNSEDEYVVVQSTRTEMIYDTVDEAKKAYKDIQNAKEEGQFETEKSSEDLDKEVSAPIVENETVNETDADYHFGMSILANELGFEPTTEQKAQPHIDLQNPVSQNVLDKYTGKSGYATEVTPSPGANSQVGKDPVTASEHNEHSSLLQPEFPVSNMEHELTLGVNREMEHVNRPDQALEIAIDHLAENPNYYTLLNKVLPESGVEEKPSRNVSVTPKKDEERTPNELADTYDYHKAYEEYMKDLFKHDK